MADWTAETATVDMQLSDDLLSAPAFAATIPDTRCFLYPFEDTVARLTTAACGSDRIRFRYAGHKVATLSWDRKKLRITLRFPAAPVGKLVFQGKAFASDLQRSKYKPDYLVGPWGAERMSAPQLVALMYWQNALYTDPATGVTSPMVRLSTACRRWRPALCAAAEALVVQPPPPRLPLSSIGPIGSLGSSDLDFLAVFASSHRSQEAGDVVSKKARTQSNARDSSDTASVERSSSSGLSPRVLPMQVPWKRARVEAKTPSLHAASPHAAPAVLVAPAVPAVSTPSAFVAVVTTTATTPPPALSSAVPFAGALAPSPLRKGSAPPQPASLVPGVPYGKTPIQVDVATVYMPSLWRLPMPATLKGTAPGLLAAPCFVFTGALELTVQTAAL